MGRRIDVDDLVTATDIAERLGVKRAQVVHDWRRRHPDFPAPLVTRPRVLLWAWKDVKAWARRTGRL
jgi:predicted DNA-binding transcriptional regulator AlpA